MKKLRYILEAIFVYLAFGIFSVLPVELSSNIGGWIGRTIGPRLGASRKARANLENSFPGKTARDIDSIILAMWDNLGRVFTEYPHLRNIALNRCEVSGLEYLQDIKPESPVIVICGHLANWELQPFYFNYKTDRPVSCVYREPNNPYTAKILDRARNPESRGKYIPKSQRGAREIVNTIRGGDNLIILIDQKYNEGIPADFFGRAAMTSTSFAQLATKYDCPIIPVQIERLPSCRFRLTIHPPFRTEGRTDEDIVLYAHKLLEEWITARPGQWLWLHRRWNSKTLKDFHN